MGEVKELTGDEFRRMQLLQLDMLVELDRVCRKHGIRYAIFGGTLLGSIRNKGYIPWDDDADVVMLREEYDKLKRVACELDPNICYFQDNDTDSEYRWGYGKLRRTGTSYVRVGQEHLKCKTGFFIDVLPLDDIPLSVPGQILNDFHCFCLRKILWSEVGKRASSESSFMRTVYGILSRISPKTVFSRVKRMTDKSSNDAPNRVRILLFPAVGKLYRKKENPLRERYGMPKSWFLDLAEYEFEGRMFYGPKDYETALVYEYGDYRELPPEDKRVPHACASEYSFGPYGG